MDCRHCRDLDRKQKAASCREMARAARQKAAESITLAEVLDNLAKEYEAPCDDSKN